MIQRRSARTAALLAAAALAGCDLAPHYVRPAGKVPVTWPTGPAYQPNQPGTAGLAWRQVFTAPKLQTVISRALANNQNLEASLANVQIAYANFRAQRSNLFPTIQGLATGSFTTRGTGASSSSSSNNGTSGNGGTGTGTGGTGNGGTGTGGTGNGGTIGGTGSTPGSTSSGITSSGSGVQAGIGFSAFTLDLFGRERNLTRQAFQQYLSTDAGYRSARITLIGAVADAYALFASDRDLLLIAQQTEQSAGLTLKLVRLQLNAGIASRADVANAEAVYATARSDVANETTLVAQDRNALELLVGGTVEEALLPRGLAELDPSIAVTPAGLSSQVLLNRPDVRAAEHTIEASNASIGAARAAFFPDITLTALAGAASRGLISLFTNSSFGASTTPSISLPILGGPYRANLALARAEQRQAIAQYRYTVQTAFREVADGLARQGTIREQRAANAENVGAATTGYQLLYQQFQVGLGTLIDALTAQRTLYTARQTQVNTVLTDIQNRVNLYQYIGSDDGR